MADNSYKGSYQLNRDDMISNLDTVLSRPIGTVTSRDQIIDPYSLVDPSTIGNDAKSQALYNSLLARAKLYAERQEASYQEWYNSYEQQVIRQRHAGLNPDLNGVESSESSDVAVPESSPLDNIPNQESLNAQTIADISSIVGTVATLCALPFNIGASVASMGVSIAQQSLLESQADLTNSQAVSQEMQNRKLFESNVFGSVSSLLADAISINKGLDISSWLAEPKNTAGVFEAYAPSGITSSDPVYSAAFKRALNNVQKHKSAAFGINNEAIGNQQSFSQALNNPYFDENLLLNIALTDPLMQAIDKKERLLRDYQTKLIELSSPEDEMAAKNAKFKYDTQYFTDIVSREDAARILQIELDNIIKGAESDVMKNYRDIYKKDPTSIVGQRAAFTIMGKDRMNLKEFLTLYGIDLVTSGADFTDDSGVPVPYRPTSTDPKSKFYNPYGMPLNKRGVPISFGD